MSALQLGRVVVTESGVYQPPALKMEVALMVVALLVVLTSFSLGRVSAASAWSSLTVLAVLVVARLVAYRKFGPLGKPTVVFQEGSLVFSLPQDSRGQVVVALAEFEQLVVYGRTGRRIFRFVQQDGRYIEVVPAWGAEVEQAAVAFLQRRLAPALRVTVEEPQTLFASVRGDGPNE